MNCFELLTIAILTALAVYFFLKQNPSKKQLKAEKRRLQSILRNRKADEKKRIRNRKLPVKSTTTNAIAIDFSHKHESEKEENSLCKQLCCIFGKLRRENIPLVPVHFCSFSYSSAQMNAGLNAWSHSQIHSKHVSEIFPDAIYLTPDSENVLHDIRPGTVYVIGGIVDKTVRKYQSLKSLGGMRHARLPLKEFGFIKSKVLNVDFVFEILHRKILGADWETALFP